MASTGDISGRGKRLGWGKPLLLLLGVALGVLGAELALRWVGPPDGFPRERRMLWMGQGSHLMLDPDFGFRPILDNKLFNEYGTRVNDYDIAKRPGVGRLLFVGDSVTFRGKIVGALRARYGEQRYEYWNAGVSGFNVVQEANYDKRYNAAVEPDHVILTFHTNDFETTPVAFRKDGDLVVFAPGRPLEQISPWLFRHSRLYRMWVGRHPRDSASDAIIDETENSLVELKRQLDREGIRLSVLLLPLLAPDNEWKDRHRRSREASLSLLEAHDFRYFDLLDVMNRALEDGIDVRQDPGDRWHPSDAVAERFADYLFQAGLLTDADGLDSVILAP